MTPTQAYELALLFAARKQTCCERMTMLRADIAAHQRDGPEGERVFRDVQDAFSRQEATLNTLYAIETEVRHVLGIAHGEPK